MRFCCYLLRLVSRNSKLAFFFVSACFKLLLREIKMFFWVSAGFGKIKLCFGKQSNVFPLFTLHRIASGTSDYKFQHRDGWFTTNCCCCAAAVAAAAASATAAAAAAAPSVAAAAAAAAATRCRCRCCFRRCRCRRCHCRGRCHCCCCCCCRCRCRCCCCRCCCAAATAFLGKPCVSRLFVGG